MLSFLSGSQVVFVTDVGFIAVQGIGGGGGPKGHPLGIWVCHYVFAVGLEAVVIFLGFGSVITYSLLGWRLGSEKFVGWSSATDGSANIQSVVAVNTKQTENWPY